MDQTLESREARRYHASQRDVLKSAVTRARLGNDDKLDALRRLEAQARRMEHDASCPALPALIDAEMSRSHAYAGRSVFGYEPAPEGAQPGGNAGMRKCAIAVRNRRR